MLKAVISSTTGGGGGWGSVGRRVGGWSDSVSIPYENTAGKDREREGMFFLTGYLNQFSCGSYLDCLLGLETDAFASMP